MTVVSPHYCHVSHSDGNWVVQLRELKYLDPRRQMIYKAPNIIQSLDDDFEGVVKLPELLITVRCVELRFEIGSKQECNQFY